VGNLFRVLMCLKLTFFCVFWRRKTDLFSVFRTLKTWVTFFWVFRRLKRTYFGEIRSQKTDLICCLRWLKISSKWKLWTSAVCTIAPQYTIQIWESVSDIQRFEQTSVRVNSSRCDTIKKTLYYHTDLVCVILIFQTLIYECFWEILLLLSLDSLMVWHNKDD
jgi:hypothetical protein